MIDLLGEHVDFMCDQTTNTTNQIKSGLIKAYAVTTAQRIPALANVPSVKEAGLENLELSIWHGIYAPKGTPAEITGKLTSALQSALKDEVVLERFNQVSALAVSNEEASAAGLKAKLGAEMTRWKKVLAAESVK